MKKWKKKKKKGKLKWKKKIDYSVVPRRRIRKLKVYPSKSGGASGRGERVIPVGPYYVSQYRIAVDNLIY